MNYRPHAYQANSADVQLHPSTYLSRIKIGIGAGLLAAIPPQSRQLWRLDVAVPVSADAHARWEIRLTAIRARDFWREPRDVARARAGAAPSTIFTWP